MINDRWGNNVGCKHGGFYTCGDRYNPGKTVSFAIMFCHCKYGSTRKPLFCKTKILIFYLVERRT